MIDQNELIENLISRNVSEAIPLENIKKKLASGKKLRIKYGIDPSGPFLTLGHMVGLRKIRDFQKAGHQIILLFGNFTAQIGDPTGKTSTRKPLTPEEVLNNAKTYLEQASKVLDISKCEVVWNADWLGKMNFNDVLQLASKMTVSQMLERDMFQERIKNSLPISIHEFLYPLMQGYDSVVLKADIEIGGTDQTFNMMTGHYLQKAYEQSPQAIITVKLLVGTDGVKKMSKSENNFIAVLDQPKEIFGKIMSIPDDQIINFYELCTDLTLPEIAEIKKRLTEGENPRNIKVELAKKIVEIYHSLEQANLEAQNFDLVFSQKQLPTDLVETNLTAGKYLYVDLLVQLGLSKSKSDAKRLIEGGGLKVNQEKITNIQGELILENKQEIILQAGKKNFIKLLGNA